MLSGRLVSDGHSVREGERLGTGLMVEHHRKRLSVSALPFSLCVFIATTGPVNVYCRCRYCEKKPSADVNGVR